MYIVLTTKFVITVLYSNIKFKQYSSRNDIHMQKIYNFFSSNLGNYSAWSYIHALFIFKAVLYFSDWGLQILLNQSLFNGFLVCFPGPSKDPNRHQEIYEKYKSGFKCAGAVKYYFFYQTSALVSAHQSFLSLYDFFQLKF